MRRCLLLIGKTSKCVVIFSNLVRHSAARVVAAIASIEIPLGQWNELLPFLQQTCTSSAVTHREVGIYILFTVLENIVEGFESHLQDLFRIFERLIQDPESAEVRVTTVRCADLISSVYTILILDKGLLVSSPNTLTLPTSKTLYVRSAHSSIRLLTHLFLEIVPNAFTLYHRCHRSVC